MTRLALSAPALLVVVMVVACTDRIDYSKGAAMTGGDPAAGKEKIILHDCHSCHAIPGIPEIKNSRGPALTHWSQRNKIAKQWSDTPENLQDFLEHPDRMLHAKGMKTEISMPTVKPADAKDITAYLFSIE